jgi:outer membrane protein assembly factor BamB
VSGPVFFGGLDGLVYALDAQSGRRLWKRDLGSPIWTPMLLLARGLYVGTFDGHVHRLSEASGAALGEMDVGGLPFGPLTAAGDSLLLLVASDDRGATLKAIDLSLTGVRWSRDPSAGKWTSGRPYFWKQTVLAGSGEGELAAISPIDGSVSWSSTLEGTIRGIGAGTDTLYVGTLEGTLYAYTPGVISEASHK